MEIENIPISEVIPYENNPRKNKKAVDVVAKSIKEFGFKVPIILDKNNVIVAGHTRLKAAIKLGLTEVPIIWADDLNPEQVKAFRIMDNKSIEYASWDMELLKGELEFLKEKGFDLALTGFENFLDNSEEDNFQLPKEPKYKIEKGEVWQLGEHRLMCGDSTSKENVDILMNGVKADICFHSPPYNVGHNLGYKSDSKYINSDDNMDDYDKFLINTTMNSINNAKEVFVNIQLLANNKHDIINFIHPLNKYFKDIFYWNKLQVAPAMAKNVANSQVEIILLFGLKNNRTFGNKEFRGNFSNYIETSSNNDNKNSDVHNAGYPIELPSIFLKHAYTENSSVLDLFGGTGTTLISCEQLNRKCYMMELDPYYCSVIVQRWEELTNKTAVKLQKGDKSD